MTSGRAPFHGWSGTTCLVTGGLGFIGSNVARALVAAGASVRVVDALVAGHGGRPDQLADVELDATLIARIDDPAVADLLDGVDAVFNMAGQVSHTASMRDPYTDLALNAVSHAGFLEHVRTSCPTARIVHTSTRQVYGRNEQPLVDEDVRPRPIDVNGVAKLAGEQLHLVYAQAYGLRVTALRLTNVYGPRQRLTSDEIGFLPVFLRRALTGEEIRIFGDGSQRRDLLHIDDVVDAIAVVASAERAVGELYNVGHPRTWSLAEIAAEIVSATGSPAGLRCVPWPDEHARIDIGSFHTGSARFREQLGWEPTVELAEGIRHTVAFYREHPCYLSST